MRIKILSVLAAVALVGACETGSKESGKSSGSGSTALKLAYTAEAPAPAKAASRFFILSISGIPGRTPIDPGKAS